MNLKEWLKSAQTGGSLTKMGENPNNPLGNDEDPLKKAPFPLEPPGTPWTPEEVEKKEKDLGDEKNSVSEKKRSRVPGGSRGFQGETAVSRVESKELRLPYFTPEGTLVIPFDSAERFHWWKLDGARMSVTDITAEVRSWMAGGQK